MRLCEHGDFAAAITETAAHHGLSEQVVEKDYFITEVLRTVCSHYGEKVIFKGGTSLSKGWDLIRRLSEDVDLLVPVDRFEPPLGSNRAPRELEVMRDMIGQHVGLTLHGHDSEKFDGGRSRRDPFGYETNFDLIGLAPTVIAEPGVAGGVWPAEIRQIESQVGRFLRDQGSVHIAEDLEAFGAHTLHYRRTFVEKLFLVHALAERLLNADKPFDRDARHYYDLYVLAGQAEVREMLKSEELSEIKSDCSEISLKHFPKQYTAPEQLSFRESSALFPPSDLKKQIRADYQQQCALLCFGSVPDFETVLDRFEEIRAWL